MKKIILILSLVFLSMTLVNATSYIFEQSELVNFRFRCLDQNNSYCSSSTQLLMSIEYPDGSNAVDNSSMTYNSTYFNHTLPTDILGEYSAIIISPTVNGTASEFTYEVTPTGKEKINTGEGISLLLSLIVMLAIGIFFFLISLKFESNAGKIICVGLSGIVFFIAILYSLVILDQTFGGFSTLTESYANFWMVMKVIISVILTFFTLYVFLVIFKWWNIKRGLLDVD